MWAKGWRPTGQTVRRVLEPPTARLRPISSGTVVVEDGITIYFEGWEDGIDGTWVGLVTVTSDEGDYVSHVQQLDFHNPEAPELLYDAPAWVDTDWSEEARGSHSCPEPCEPSGQAQKRVRWNPNFKEFYKCGGAACGAAGLVSLLGWLTVPEYMFASMFWNSCTVGLLACSWNLWQWGTPRRPRR
jgi:hypothetical protein